MVIAGENQRSRRYTSWRELSLLRPLSVVIAESRSIRLVRLLVCLSVVLLAFLSPVAQSEQSDLVVGLALPLSGEAARYGLDIQRGATMAQEELAQRGVKLSFIAEDTQLLPRIAATAAQKLINRDRVDLVVSLWDTAEAVAPIAEQKRIPHLSIRWNHRVAQEFPHTFTFESTYETWVRATLEYLRSRGVRKLAVMTDASSAGWVVARTLHESALFGLSSAWMHLQIPKRSVGIWSLQFVWALWVPHKL